MEKNSVWDEEKLQKLKSLWDEGLTYYQNRS